MLHLKGKILPKNFREKFIIELRKEMREQSWTAQDLSKRLGVCERTVKAWLRDERFPNGIDLIKLMCFSVHIRKYILEIVGANEQYIDVAVMKLLILDALDKL